MKANAVTRICMVLLILQFLLSSCQQSPNANIVTSKNDGSFDVNTVISASEHRDPDATQSAVYGEKFYSTDGTVQFLLSIDETVTAVGMPVVEVEPHYLTEQEAERVAKVLFCDTEYYEAEIMLSPVYSRSDIQEKIERWSQYTNNVSVESLFGEKREDTVDLVKKFIADYTQQMTVAPTDNPHVPCKWEYQKESYYYFPPEMIANTSNDNDMIRASLVSGDIHYIYNVEKRNGDDYKISYISAYLDDGIGPDFIDVLIFRAKLCRTNEPTEDQLSMVKAKAESMLQQMMLGDWLVDECYLETKYYGDVPEYIIHVNAVPVLNGVPAIRSPQLTNLTSEESYASNYYLTDAKFEFSANGELVSFCMYSPIDIKSIVNDNVAVMSIDKLVNKAKTHLSLSDYYEYGFGPVIDSVDEELGCIVNIIDLEYNLTRVKVPNTDESYYYIPGISLIGNVEYYGKDTGNVYFTNDSITLVTLNGVDGSVVKTTNE